MRIDQRPVICLVTDRARLSDASSPDDLVPILRLLADAAEAGVDVIQIREHDLSDRALLELTQQVVSLTRETTTRVVVNDRVDVALLGGADGVHLKAASMPAPRVRHLAPDGWIVGRSVHSVAEAEQVSDAGGLDYLMAGTVFETASKPHQDLLGAVGLEAVVGAVSLPVWGIGGITVDRVPAVARAGAAGIAAIGAFMEGGADLRRLVTGFRHGFDI